MENLNYDIFVFKTKNNLHSDDWEAQSTTDSNYERGLFIKAYNKAIKAIGKLEWGTEEYRSEYAKQFDKLSEYFNFPLISLKPIRMTDKTTPTVATLTEYRDMIAGKMKQKFEADYENVDIVFNFLAKEIKSGSCWITEEIVNDGINRCTRVLNDKSLAPTLLPFTGDYDEDYFQTVKQFRMSLKKFKTLIKKGFELYALIVGEKIGEE